jgi:Tol biopolymer transport system component
MNTDGTNQLRLTDAIGTDFMPAWNPDGNIIVFVYFRNNEKAIYTMNSDGTNQTPIMVSVSPDQPNDPTFSIDGNKIAFSTNNRIHIMNSDGTDITSLTGTSYNGNPDWK